MGKGGGIGGESGTQSDSLGDRLRVDREGVLDGTEVAPVREEAAALADEVSELLASANRAAPGDRQIASKPAFAACIGIIALG